jgi:hypothetical protein
MDSISLPANADRLQCGAATEHGVPIFDEQILDDDLDRHNQRAGRLECVARSWDNSFAELHIR